MLGTVFISAAFAFLITVHAASVELARDDDQVSDTATTLSPPQSEVPDEVPEVMERSGPSSGPNDLCAAGSCTNTTEGQPQPMP
uniref:Putative secreted mucin n=1 Tax=Amblyomma cajennense TaxID=34607 RepID=A0A023FBB1_AMBCJ